MREKPEALYRKNWDLIIYMVFVYIYICIWINVTRVSDAWFSDWVWVRYFFEEGDGRNKSGGFSRRPDSRAGPQHRLAAPTLLSCISYIYNYFRTALESFEPLISRVGQTIRFPLRIQIKWPRIKRAVCASHRIATTASILHLLPANVIFCQSYIFIYLT